MKNSLRDEPIPYFLRDKVYSFPSDISSEIAFPVKQIVVFLVGRSEVGLSYEAFLLVLLARKRLPPPVYPPFVHDVPRFSDLEGAGDDRIDGGWIDGEKGRKWHRDVLG